MHHRVRNNPLDPFDVPQFLRDHRIVVLSVHRSGKRFPRPLHDALVRKYGSSLATARIDLRRVNEESLFISNWIEARNVELGRRPDARVVPGFYLFVSGRLHAFHPGITDFNNLQVVGALASIFGTITDSPNVAHIGDALADIPVSERVREYFEPLIDEWLDREVRLLFDNFERNWERKRIAEQREREHAVARAAMRRLGIPEEASENEAKRVWRELAVRTHPDHFRHADEKKRAHEAFVELEQQWMLICIYKGWR